MGIVVAIGGASRSGKTTLAHELDQILGKKYSVRVLHQDDYIVPESQIPLVRDEIDWEHPASLNHSSFALDIIKARNDNQVVIAEGFLIFAVRELQKLFDLRFFVKVDKETFFSRRRADRRYGTDAEWYIEHTWNSYLKWGQLSELNESVTMVVDNDYDAEQLVQIIEKHLARQRKS